MANPNGVKLNFLKINFIQDSFVVFFAYVEWLIYVLFNPSLQRRSSFKNPQVQEELRNLIPQEVFRGSYSEYNLSNIARLSGNSQRGSLQRPRGSGIPTPTLRRAVVASSSSVSRNVVLAAPKSATSVASSSVSRSAKSNQSSQPQNILRLVECIL